MLFGGDVKDCAALSHLADTIVAHIPACAIAPSVGATAAPSATAAALHTITTAADSTTLVTLPITVAIAFVLVLVLGARMITTVAFSGATGITATGCAIIIHLDADIVSMQIAVVLFVLVGLIVASQVQRRESLNLEEGRLLQPVARMHSCM